MKTESKIAEETWNKIKNLLRFDILGVFSLIVLLWLGFMVLLGVIEDKKRS